MEWKDIGFANPAQISYLYHYQRFEISWIETLLNKGAIKFSVPGSFNDPWDCRPCYDKSFLNDKGKLEEQIQYFIEASRRQKPEKDEASRQATAQEWRSNPETVSRAIDACAAEVAKAIDTQYRVYCLTPKADCQLMWAHYASSHTGVCLEFSTRNNVASGALQVKYLDKYPVLNFADNTEIGNILPLVTKSSVWSYEQEYRLIAEEEDHHKANETLKTKNNFFQLPNKMLTGIIMGCMIKESDKKILEDTVSKLNPQIQLKRAVRVPDKYSLEIINTN
jgi:hypothetical protein